MLKCSKCGLTKPESEFNKNQSYCKQCQKQYNKEHRKKNPKKPKLKHCSVCGEPFYTSGKGRFTVCKWCKIRRKNRQNLKKKPKKKPRKPSHNRDDFSKGYIYVLVDVDEEDDSAWKLEVRK